MHEAAGMRLISTCTGNISFLFQIANIVTTSKAPVTTSVALVTSSK